MIETEREREREGVSMRVRVKYRWKRPLCVGSARCSVTVDNHSLIYLSKTLSSHIGPDHKPT